MVVGGGGISEYPSLPGAVTLVSVEEDVGHFFGYNFRVGVDFVRVQLAVRTSQNLMVDRFHLLFFIHVEKPFLEPVLRNEVKVRFLRGGKKGLNSAFQS